MKSIFKEYIANFKHFKSAYIINILGLAVAITVFIGIILQLIFEMGYDRFRPNAEYIYRVESFDPTNKGYESFTYTAIGNTFKENCPEITNYFIATSETGIEQTFILERENGEREKFREKIVETIDSSIVNMLNINIISGLGQEVLNEPNMLLIPQSIAKKWFGDRPAIQQKVIYNGYIPCTIGAVYEDSPQNSIFKNPCYIKYTYPVRFTWQGPSNKTYIHTSTNNTEELQQKINNINIPELGPQIKDQPRFRLTKLTDLYYYDTTLYKSHEEGRMTDSLLLLAIGIIIMIIAIINFINFNMSMAPTQIRKINTHRILGAKKTTLIIKIIFNNLISWSIAFLLAMFLLQLFSLASGNLLITSIAPFNNLSTIGNIAIVILLLAILSGIYPAWYCTSFSPALIIKGNFILTPQGKSIRNGLLTFQIFTSIFLTVCTIVIISQNRFLQNYNLGIETTNVGYIKNYRLYANKNSITNDIEQIPEITGHTFTNWIPGVIVHNEWSIPIEGADVTIGRCVVDKNFTNFFNIPILKGENFSEYNQKKQVILNEAALKYYPTIEQNFGKNFYELGTFIGIAKDAHCNSILSKTMPTFFTLAENENDYYYLFVKITGNQKIETIGKLKKIFNKLAPDDVIEFKFLDQAIQMQYEKEQKLAKLISLLGSIAFALALIGVFSLVVFNTQYKRQEIAIRKINGATENEIIAWLNKGFIRLVTIAFLISCPISYWVCYKWLESFVHKTTIHWWFFGIAGVGTLLLVTIIVSWQSRKAALKNPIESLKSE